MATPATSSSSRREPGRSDATSLPGAARIRTCPFHDKDAPVLDYKDVRLMRRFMSSYAKIQPRRRSGLCAKHQRMVTNELKKTRFIGLLSFVQQ